MEVDKDSFNAQMLPLLHHIANATYVTFDLEMSGISTRPRYSVNDRSHELGKPSLQEQYEEVKDAADTYQIVQVGITCVEEDREKEFYLARPYNFNLSPLLAGGCDLKLERTFSFSSSACDFLKKNGFDFGKVFSSGVPYLSQEEAEDLREEFKNRADKNASIPMIVIQPSDTATLDFYGAARKTISKWVEDTKPKTHFVNISRDDGALNAFQRRLIHQLVRTEFPGHRTFARNDGHFMQVERVDEKKEAEFQRRLLDKFNSQIAKQTGLRWVFEALSNGDLSGISPAWFCDPNSEDASQQLVAKRRELEEVVQKLKSKEHIIVGHNLFIDLIFVYKTFFGTLPNSVKHFQEDIHEKFRVVFDTKYIATEGTNSMEVRTNLKELLAPFKKIHTPLVLLHEHYTAYGSAQGKDHEAGFDSWMTAELFAKLACKLYTSRKPHLIEETGWPEDSDTSDESGGALIEFDGNTPYRPRPVKPHNPQNTNLYSLLAGLEEDLPVRKVKVAKPEQWFPMIISRFWTPYINKLRVNASEGGVCDLAEAEVEDE